MYMYIVYTNSTWPNLYKIQLEEPKVRSYVNPTCNPTILPNVANIIKPNSYDLLHFNSREGYATNSSYTLNPITTNIPRNKTQIIIYNSAYLPDSA